MQSNDIRRPAALFLALFLIPALLVAQPPGRGGRGFHRGGPMDERSPIDRLAERLDLTAAQREAIGAIFDAHRDDLEQKREAVAAAHRALGEATHAEVFDEAAIRALGQELGAAQAELMITRGRMHQEIRQQLTAEQQEVFDQGMGRRFGPRRGRGFGPHGPRFGDGPDPSDG